jgi:selenocysteine lyase/cysteine desulfurase
VTAPRLGDRTLFPLLEARAYLNHAGVSPPSDPVRRAVAGAIDDVARLGGAAVGVALERRAQLRARIAELLGAAPADVALTSNTTTGIQAVALDFPWRRGDRVVLLDGEFPANVTPWQQAAEAFGLSTAFVPVAAFLRSEEEGLAALDAELRQGVRLVAVSAVQFRSGLAMPLPAMAARCAAAGAEIFVDAVQAAGAVPLDVRGIDYLAAGGHKWLMGPSGTGFLWVRPERARALVPRTAGWLSHEDPIRFLVDGPGLLRHDRPIQRGAGMVEGGGLPDALLAGLLASLEAILSLGVPTIAAHVGGYLDRLEPELVARGFRSLRVRPGAGRSGILSVEPPPGTSAAALARELRGRRVSCATPDGALRFAPHWPNDPGEIPGVVEAVDGALAAVAAR